MQVRRVRVTCFSEGVTSGASVFLLSSPFPRLLFGLLCLLLFRHPLLMSSVQCRRSRARVRNYLWFVGRDGGERETDRPTTNGPAMSLCVSPPDYVFAS